MSKRTIRYFVTDPATGIEREETEQEVTEFYAELERLTGLPREDAERMYVRNCQDGPVRIEVT